MQGERISWIRRVVMDSESFLWTWSWKKSESIKMTPIQLLDAHQFHINDSESITALRVHEIVSHMRYDGTKLDFKILSV